ncbi:MAG: glutamyl-tRNA reductase, partial [Chloroflexi bacterium]|nr:glutamyl-tRNA reductase [Chloroflexota bacterium]
VPGVILGTCNRSEFYTIEPPNEPGSNQPWKVGEERVKQFLVDRFNIALLDLDRYLYVHREQECIEHLFRVASSLDSMIMGEEQIIGQVRDAFDFAGQAGTVPGPLSHLFQRALRVGRKVRRETGIGRDAPSVSQACVELARKALGDLKGRRSIVVGAGDAGELAARALRRAGVKEISVANRTQARAQELAGELSGQAIALEELPNALLDTDIVIGCTGAPEYILAASAVRDAMADRPHRPLFLLDIAVPRDFDPAAGSIDGVHLHDLDDLESVAQTNRHQREQEARWAERLVTDETQRFLEWSRNLEVVPTVVALRNKADRIREKELGKTLKRLNGKLSAEEVASLDAMTQAIVNKLLHAPTVYLKGQPNSGNLKVAREFFKISEEDILQASED